MRVLITSDQHYHRTPDGAVWTPNQFAYSYWRRYLQTFDEVLVAGRTEEVAAPLEDAQRADGHGVRFLALPSFLGPVQFGRQLPRIAACFREAGSRAEALILRLPSGIGAAAGTVLRRPYGVEIVADPLDALSPGGNLHPLRPVARVLLTRLQRRLCRRAAAASYVTESALQERYPTRGPSFGVSDVELPSQAFAEATRQGIRDPRMPILVAIGTMAAQYKGQDNLLRAFAILRRNGCNARLRLGGDGRHMADLRTLATSLGIAEQVDFLGNLAGSVAVRQALDAADVFVLASRAEGLSRALLEAMARGLPCVATAVGGTPEVLPSEVLARSNDPEAFAATVAWLVASRERMVAASQANLTRARDFHEERLADTRRAFLREVARAATSQAFDEEADPQLETPPA